uniref:dual oxidase 1-like isoform X2 n=2 Tax=Myxine glutinosa TaxID=7769 RepID=UPI0035900797
MARVHSGFVTMSRCFSNAYLVLAFCCLAWLADGYPLFEIQRFDGWYNNLARTDWGSAGHKLLRLASAHYADGVYHARGEPSLPNPRAVSRTIMRGDHGLPSSSNRTVLSVFFGQHVMDDIVDTRHAGCPVEFLNIHVPPQDPVFNSNSSSNVMVLFRSQWDKSTGVSPNNPRLQTNTVTAWLDGSAIYGSSHVWCSALRTFKDGLLTTGKDPSLPPVSKHRLRMQRNPPPAPELTPENQDIIYEFGNAWGNESPFLRVLGTVWLRFHNFQAKRMKDDHPDWSDEDIFLTARKWVIAVYQNIVFYEWLPAFIGKNATEYPGYKMFVDPSISVEFEAAAMKFGHTMVPPGVYRRNASCDFKPFSLRNGSAERLCNTFWERKGFMSGHDVDELLLGMCSQIAEKEDQIIVDDLLDSMYGPLKSTRVDLMAITIQRGRDHGVPSYNSVRRALNLQPARNWTDVQNNIDGQIVKQLEELYGDVSNLELWPGGLLESDGEPGVLFSAIILEQFQRLRDGDRFWFENTNNGLFTDNEVIIIRKMTFANVLKSVLPLESGPFQENVFFWHTGDPCPQPRQLQVEDLGKCTPSRHVDYFDGSTVGFALSVTILFLFPIISFGALLLSSRHQKKSLQKLKKKEERSVEQPECIQANEWLGKSKGSREVQLKIMDPATVQTMDPQGKHLRSVCFCTLHHVTAQHANDKGGRTLVLHVPKEHDLVLVFASEMERTAFEDSLENILKRQNITLTRLGDKEKSILQEAATQEQRNATVERFFRKLFSEILEIPAVDSDTCQEEPPRCVSMSLECELTRMEFADTLGLKASSSFVQQMFELADRDKNGYLSFRELFNILVIFMKGSNEAKSQLMFQMYDIKSEAIMSKNDFCLMISSFLELSNCGLSSEVSSGVMNSMLREEGMHNQEQFTWHDLHKIFSKNYSDTECLRLHLSGLGSEQKPAKERTASFILQRKPNISKKSESNHNFNEENNSQMYNQNKRKRQSNAKVFTEAERNEPHRGKFLCKVQLLKRSVENYRQHIFCCTIFYTIIAGIMLERAYYYAIDSEHFGIRQVTEVGIILSRSTAAGISFTYSFILLTMCRNLNTFLRETFLKHYIPFDSAVAFHRIIAKTAIVLVILHTVGHVVNVFHFVIHPRSVLSCLFPMDIYDDGSDVPPKYTWWFFGSIPGLTGILILAVLAVMYVFADRYSRRNSFKAFWITHKLYVVLYLLIILHGSMAIIQKPMFYLYFIVPALLYSGDALVSLSRKKVELCVYKAELLPSGVTHLQFKRPQHFHYKSGQWVRIACLSLSQNEYHPFTLTSAPHEDALSVHIRAVGPWTMRLREAYNSPASCCPKIYLDGPFGEGHQDWNEYEVSVLVGGGIGVTPFASILKDIVHKSHRSSRFIKCKKVYFIWVTRTQHQFEWLTDIIKEVEENDEMNLVSVHIYITQFAEKFDLRTSMLYIFERHFQKEQNRSLFTGLHSITHFGRPQFVPFLNSLQNQHPEVNKVGVFSCGPPTMTKKVEEACRQLNRKDRAHFKHHYENF